MSWHLGSLALLDFETSGVDPHRDRIVSAAVIHVTPGTMPVIHDWLVNPGIEIPEAASAVHGITTAKARASGVDPAGAVWEIADLLVKMTAAGAAIVGHNVTYDLTMLHAELTRNGAQQLRDQIATITPVVDTFILDKQVDPYRKGSRRLVDVAAHYGVELSEDDAHGAAADALAAGRVAWKIAHRHPKLHMPAVELHRLQVGWKRAQADSFGRYLAKQGKLDDVAREWPLQPAPPGWSPEQLPHTPSAVAS